MRSDNPRSGRHDTLARRLFMLSVVMLTFASGFTAGLNGLFPAPQARSARTALVEFLRNLGLRSPWYLHDTSETQPVRILEPSAISPGLTLVSGMAADRSTWVRAMEPEGRVVHSWRVTWDEIWPDPTHLEDEELPRGNPSMVHGIALLPNADLVFNFQKLGMVRLNPCGDVVWRLPYRTHHSVHVDDRGHLWAPGLVTRHSSVPGLLNHAPPFDDYTVVEVSPEGRILTELSVFDLLKENGLSGLLYMSTIDNISTLVSGDTLHLNDVETFPASLASGVFEAGDVMISLRNINAVLVFTARTRRIKFMTIGRVLRQHDPDFVDGNTISVFDNNNLAGSPSRIVTISATGRQRAHVRFEGTAQQPFRTGTMGMQQRLPNGNLLVVEAVPGRVLEVDSAGTIVWQYTNVVRDGIAGMIDDAIRLPPEVDAAFFGRAVSACRSTAKGSVGARLAEAAGLAL